MPAAPAFIPIGVDPLMNLSEEATQRALTRDDFDVLAIVRRLRELAIDIDSFTCPKLIDQLLAAAKRPMELLCNGLDSDEGAALNAALLAGFAQDIRTGVAVTARAAGAASAQIVVDSNTSRPRFGSRSSDAVKVVAMDPAYPSTHPSILIRARYNRSLLPGRLPTERGILVIDAVAAWIIARIAADQRSVAMPILVRDLRRRQPILAAVAPELKVSELLASLHIALDERTAILNGPRLRKVRVSLDAKVGAVGPVIEICPAERTRTAEPCVRCNWCAEICPTRVLPMLVLEASQFNDPALAEDAGLRRCIDCGLCDYVCPSHLPLTTAIARMRTPVASERDG